MEIWESPAYRAFRRPLARRAAAAATIALSALGAHVEEAPPPEACRTCPKLYGF
jgi:hypothetical protein